MCLASDLYDPGKPEGKMWMLLTIHHLKFSRFFSIITNKWLWTRQRIVVPEFFCDLSDMAMEWANLLRYSYLHSACFYSSIGGERAAQFKFQIQDVCVQSSHVWLFGTLRTVAHQAPLSIGFLRPEDWSGLPFPSPVALQDPGIKLASLTLAVGFFTSVTWETCSKFKVI